MYPDVVARVSHPSPSQLKLLELEKRRLSLKN